MDLDTVLDLAPTLSMLPLGEDLSVFNAETGHTLALNRTAADILALVDGSTSLAQISTVVATAYEQPVPEVEAVVGEVAETLLGAWRTVTVGGLRTRLTNSSRPSAPPTGRRADVGDAGSASRAGDRSASALDSA